MPSLSLLFSMVASFRVGKTRPGACAERVLGARRGGGGYRERELRPSPPPPPPPPPELSAGTEMQVGPEPEPPYSSVSILSGTRPWCLRNLGGGGRGGSELEGCLAPERAADRAGPPESPASGYVEGVQRLGSDLSD